MADERPPRNPFRNEADAFRLLVIVALAGALIVVVTLAAGTAAGFVLAAVLGVLALWRVAGWTRYWLGIREDQE